MLSIHIPPSDIPNLCIAGKVYMHILTRNPQAAASARTATLSPAADSVASAWALVPNPDDGKEGNMLLWRLCHYIATKLTAPPLGPSGRKWESSMAIKISPVCQELAVAEGRV